MQEAVVMDMTLIQWRQNKECVRRASKILDSPDFIEMLEVLHNTNPVYFPLPKAGVSPDDRSAQLGRIEGACSVIMALKSMGTLLDKTAEPEVSYR